MEIILKNVTYNYKSKKLLDKINLTIESNKITGITGDAKSVLCDILDGTTNMTNGQIVIGDMALIKSNLKAVKKVVSKIHQNYENQFFTNRVKEEIMFLISRLSYKPSNIEKKMEQSIEMVGLDKKVLDKDINTLTSGEKKLLQIAVSIIYNPDIIIFDEPFVELDRINTRKIINLIKVLKEKYNKTVIIVSNNVNLLYEITDNIIVLRKGHILISGETTTIYQNPNILKDKDIVIPDLVKFTLLAKNKKIKLSYHKDIRDLIKDVYKHV